MKKESKNKLVQELKGLFTTHDSFYLVDFQGMTVAQATRLRKAVRQMGGVFKVVKNRLALRAIKSGLPEEVRSFFQKPTAVAFPDGDAIALARFLKDFSSQHKVLSIKGGVLEGKSFAAEQFEEICRLGSRNELLAKIGFLLSSPLGNFLRTMQAPLVQFGYMLNQLKTKK